MCFGSLAEGAADALIALIGPAISGGIVVDAACGSGLLAERVARFGYEVRGADIAPEMIALARARLPRGRFIRASLFDVDLPQARAICAVGEAINMQVAPGEEAALIHFFGRAHASLERGGILLIDVAAPGRAAAGARGFAEGAGWSVGSVARESGDSMTRTTTLFTQGADGAWQRRETAETLSLWPRERIVELLRQAGFTVQAGYSYGRLTLPPGLIRYTAQK